MTLHQGGSGNRWSLPQETELCRGEEGALQAELTVQALQQEKLARLEGQRAREARAARAERKTARVGEPRCSGVPQTVRRNLYHSRFQGFEVRTQILSLWLQCVARR